MQPSLALCLCLTINATLVGPSSAQWSLSLANPGNSFFPFWTTVSVFLCVLCLCVLLCSLANPGNPDSLSLCSSILDR
ncbi:uncharacterized protein DS421_16g544980 [Arachis hypogaea]|nr:uncharacterized protein DS421_16g544980 [Arachis hypogaea]